MISCTFGYKSSDSISKWVKKSAYTSKKKQSTLIIIFGKISLLMAWTGCLPWCCPSRHFTHDSLSYFPAVDLNIPEVTMRFSMYLLSTWFSDLSLEFSSLTELTLWERSWRVFWSSKMWDISSSFSVLPGLARGGGVPTLPDFLREGRAAIFYLFFHFDCDSERYLEKF